MDKTGGYSFTPLRKKLGLKERHTCALYHTPVDYVKLLGGEVLLYEDDKLVDFVHWFCTTQKEVISEYQNIAARIKKDGMLWISWPKKSSSISSDLSRDWIREYVLDHGLVDVKIASFDTDYSCLKFVYRLKDR